jgi:hypothetical protein
MKSVCLIDVKKEGKNIDHEDDYHHVLEGVLAGVLTDVIVAVTGFFDGPGW